MKPSLSEGLLSAADRDSAVRGAYANRDVEASKAAHALGLGQHEEKHGEEGSEYIKSMVYGGLDGIVTTFAIVAAGIGANRTTGTILLMGFAGLIADGISMGLGDYFSTVAETDFKIDERKREAWEFENYPDGERSEMIEHYQKKCGMSLEDATDIVMTYSKYPEPFIDLMMCEELNTASPDEDEKSKAWRNGVVTLFSFWGFGSIGLWPYILPYFSLRNGAEWSEETLFILAAISVAAALYFLGHFKARFTGEVPFESGLKMLLNGSVASLAAFGVAALLDLVLQVEEC